MPNIKTKDGTRIWYKDWGEGQPIVFSHGWPLCSDAWSSQMMFLADQGYRCIAHDRRGHGRSDQPWNGNDMTTYAADLAELTEQLDLRDAIHIGHSTGGGEVARYVARAGRGRVARVVLISAVPPIMLKTPANPEGTPIEVFDAIRAGVAADQSQYFKDLSAPFFGANRPGSKVSQGVRDDFWRQAMLASIRAAYACVEAFSETDQNEDLRRIDVPTLILQGDDDQIVPIQAAAKKQARLIRNSILKVYPGAPHGMPVTHADQVNRDLLDFVEASTADLTRRAGAETGAAGREAH